MEQVKKSTIIRLLSLLMPDVHVELSNMDKNGGWIKLPEKVIDLLIQWKFNWWQLYEDEQKLKALGATMLLDNQEAKELFENNPKDTIYHVFGDYLEAVDDMPEPTDAEGKEFWDQVNSASKDEQAELLKPFCKLVLGLLSVTFNYLALMVHGRSMCQLVADAKNGDDTAYRCAVQIDRSVLRLDYFQGRLLRAQFSGDQDFLDKLSYRIKAPILQAKIKYKTLLLTFAILEDDGFLTTLSHDELLNICEEVGVYGKDFGVEDVGHLRKRLSDYRKLQRNSKYF
ncbi:hypothetical protein [Methylomonas sp. 11b]|uniref:hypothetical protein n=1 Tax=Methylomonas sp. 11b TaxID=1168169 RepID=UPI00047A6795|nr:hypothetical protein [Methylomonas sp. 11b]